MAHYRPGALRPQLAAAMLLASAIIAPTVGAREQRRDGTYLNYPQVKNMATQNYVSNYELGTLFDEYYDYLAYNGKQPCFEAPPGASVHTGPVAVDVTVPCAAMRAFFANCSLGLSLAQEASDPLLDQYPEDFQEIPNDQQQQCYCSGDYWAYNAGCNACLQLHGYPSNGEGWIPPAYVSQQSSAYCTAKPTVNFREFLNAFVPTSTTGPSADADRGPEGFYDTATAASQTGVSAYFTAPASTPVFLSATSSVSLPTYSETIPTASPSATSSSGAADPVNYLPLRYVPAAIGLAALL